jgi:hypothetical protein
MGTTMHCFIEAYDRDSRRWRFVRPEKLQVFDNVAYSIQGFFGNDHRNYAHCPMISQPKGFPNNCSQTTRVLLSEHYSVSWLSLKELQDYNYDKVFWNRRIVREEKPNFFNGSAIAREGEGTHMTIRHHLGEWYFNEIRKLEKVIDDRTKIRIIFGFRS